MGGKERKPAMLMFPSQNAKSIHLHSGSWSGRCGRQNQTGLEALTPKRRPRGFHLSQVTSTTAILPLLVPPGPGGFLCMGKGGEHGGSHSWTLQGRGRGPGGKGRGWIFTNFVTRRPGLEKGGGQGKRCMQEIFKGRGSTPNQETAGITQANLEMPEAGRNHMHISRKTSGREGPDGGRRGGPGAA